MRYLSHLLTLSDPFFSSSTVCGVHDSSIGTDYSLSVFRSRMCRRPLVNHFRPVGQQPCSRRSGGQLAGSRGSSGQLRLFRKALKGALVLFHWKTTLQVTAPPSGLLEKIHHALQTVAVCMRSLIPCSQDHLNHGWPLILVAFSFSAIQKRARWHAVLS